MLARRHQLDTISRLCTTVLDVKINQDVVVDPNRRVLSVSVITGVLSVPLTRCNPRRSFVVVEFAKATIHSNENRLGERTLEFSIAG